MDLATLDTHAAGNAGTWLEILHPVTRAPIGVRVKVHGRDSDRVREAVERQERETLEAARSNRPAPDKKTRDAQIWAAATTDWEGVEFEGAPMPFSEANALKLYGHPGLGWFVAQVAAAVMDHGRFLPP